MPSGVAARLQLLEVGQLPDVDLGRQMPADRRLQRLAWAKQSPRQRPCSVERLPGPLPQQDLQPAVADLEYDGERLMAGRHAAAGLAHRLSTYNRKLSPVARPPSPPTCSRIGCASCQCSRPPQPAASMSKRSLAPPDSPPSTAGPWPSPASPGPSWPWRSC